MQLLDHRMADGSRHFANLSKKISWTSLCNGVLQLPGATIINCIGHGDAASRLDFHFQEHRFLVHAGDEWFHWFVCDPQCSDLILYRIGCHMECVLDNAE